MNIVEFLEARITEEEAVARESQYYEQDVYEAEGWFDCTRVLAECKAKRAVVQSYRSCQHAEGEARKSMAGDAQAFGVKLVSSGMVKGMELAINHLAAVYADHPDYDPEWRHA